MMGAVARGRALSENGAVRYHAGMLTAAPTATLTPRPPFDFDLILAYLRRSPLEPLDVVVDGAYRRVARLDGQPALVEVASVGTIDAPRLVVRLLGKTADPRLLPLAVREASRWLRIEDEPADLDRLALLDPLLADVLARLRGIRFPLMPSPFECLIWAVLGQQITLAFAFKLKRALVERYGESVEYEGRPYLLFPEPAALAEADPDELRAMQLSRQKSAYVRALGAAEAGGAVDWPAVAALPTNEAIAALTALHGVGRWTAEYVLMRGLGLLDVLPAGDAGVKLIVGQAYGLGRRATETEARAIGERWAPYRSLATFAWWFTRSATFPSTPLADAPLPDAPLPDAPLPDAPLPDAPLPDAPLPDAPLPSAQLPGSLQPGEAG
ncbi:MAG: hypothetical protein IT305_23330 [Chloroflexi bacterium]|nr:hypothetical protein [Chloroflexota bacterium]